eukprot:TRINITY_DN3402_c0_g1_i4.p1 TRINITY_DN3402_c0_g1~~TRINITY_DN3402_c0_g1_i4.p1  ORF type:complete len:700 (-),score=227.89 TRINITY_DN3402_c0_g1_i4:10-2109(-)
MSLSPLSRLMLSQKTKKKQNKRVWHFNRFPSFRKLFCLFSSTFFSALEQEKRAHVQKAIQVYAAIAPPQGLNNFYRTIIKRILTSSTEISKKGKSADATQTQSDPHTVATLIDLALALAPSLDLENVMLLVRVIQPHISLPTHSLLQKRAYKTLATLCEVNKEFVSKNFEIILKNLKDSASLCAPLSKKHRLRCFIAILGNLESERQYSLLPHLLPELILATKEANMKTRENAFNLLITLAENLSAQGESEEEKGQKLQKFLEFIAAGLTGNTPHMIASTVLALSRVYYQFSEYLSADFCDTLCATVFVLFSQPNREIVKAALGFVKVALVCLDPNHILPHLPNLVPGLLRWSSDSKNHFRLKVRVIFERMIRKIGSENIYPVVGEEHKKFFVNIVKVKERTEKLKKQGKLPEAEEDDDAIEEIGTTKKQNPKLAQKMEDEKAEQEISEFLGTKVQKKSFTQRHIDAKGRTFISENEDDPLDFLNATATAQLIQSSDPLEKIARAKRLAERAAKRAAKRGGKEDEDVLVRPDGRLVVRDGESDEDLDDVAHARDEQHLNRMLRKLRSDGSDTEDDDDRPQPAAGQKRGREPDRDEGGKRARSASRSSVGPGSAKRARTSKDAEIRTGAEFKARRAGGDIKKGGVEPHAYIPLDPALLNKRRTAKARKHFAVVVPSKGVRRQELQRQKVLSKVRRAAKRK